MPVPPIVRRSLRRSRVRVRVLLNLVHSGATYAGQLAHASGVDHRRLVQALYGDAAGALYSREFGLVRLGLAREEVDARGFPFYEATALGVVAAEDVSASLRALAAP